MNKRILIFIFIVGIFLILTCSTIYAERTVNIGNVDITLPDKFSQGEIKNDNISGWFRNHTDIKNMFDVYVYGNYSANYVNYIGFILSKSNQHVDIGGHPAVFVAENNNYRGKITHIIWESNGSIVYMSLPNSWGLTNTSRDIVKSTPPAIYDSDSFYNLMDKTKSDYKIHIQEQDIIDSAYDYGYYYGYDSGYENGRPKGLLSRMFWRIGL